MADRVAIVGSRDYPHPEQVRQAVHDLPEGTVVVSGGARGVDSVAARTAQRCGLEVAVHLPDWKGLGKRAGFVRNVDIVNDCDRLIAFQHHGSRGTQHSIDLARKAGKPVEVHRS